MSDFQPRVSGINELAREGRHGGDVIAAKLAYKILNYALGK
ncbi:hypothetical protein [Emcibacter sp.]|nr:hypothetical protein [Emcibacter sp.]